MPPAWLALVLALTGPVAGPVSGHVGDARTALGVAPLAGKVVVLDPGHQLGNAAHPRQIARPVWIGNGRKPCNTTGTATNGGYPEATFAWRVATDMRAALRRLGARVLMTRTSNSRARWGPCVDTRGRLGDRQHADAKVSIHGDGSYAAGAHGFHVIYAPDRRPTADTYRGSRALALATRAALQRAGFARATYIAGGDGLDVRSDLGTLNLSDMPTVMLEAGNMRDRADAARMVSDRGQHRYAAALVRAIEGFLLTR